MVMFGYKLYVVEHTWARCKLWVYLFFLIDTSNENEDFHNVCTIIFIVVADCVRDIECAVGQVGMG